MSCGLRWLVLLLILLPGVAAAATRLGLHHTQEEVVIWQARRTIAPYDDMWTVILNSADAWVASPDVRWSGQAAATCWVNGGVPHPGRNADDGMVDAAFAYLLTGNTSYSTAVRTQLVNQMAVVGTNWADASRWCVPHDGADGLGADVAPWLQRLLLAYDYIKDTVPSGTRISIDQWFQNIAAWMRQAVDTNAKKRFPNRLAGDYSGCTSGSFCPGSVFGITHFGGPTTYSFGNTWSNQPSSVMYLVGAIGILLNESVSIDHARRYFTEWLAYGAFAGGPLFDQYRWSTGNLTPQLGYAYACKSAGDALLIADVIARTGDTSLYTMSTSNGLHGTAGGPKSLLGILQHLAGQTNGTVIQYASATSTTDPDLIIDWQGPNATQITFVNLTPANIYYKNTAIKTAYNTPLPPSYNNDGCNMWRGPWCIFPDIRYLFANQEDVVWPYGLPPPRRLRVGGVQRGGMSR